MQPLADETSREGLGLLVRNGTVVELRALGTSRGVVSGYFSDPERLAQEAARLSGCAEGVYITANPVKPDCYGDEAAARRRSPRGVLAVVSSDDALRRARTFQQQLDAWAASGRFGVLVLVKPESPAPKADRSISCGCSMVDGWRCATYLEALHVALAIATEDAEA